MSDLEIPTRIFVHGTQPSAIPASADEERAGVVVRLHDGTSDHHVGYVIGRVTYFAEYVLTETGRLDVYIIRHELNGADLRITVNRAMTYASGGWLSVSGTRTTRDRIDELKG